MDEYNRLVLTYSYGGICKEPGTDETHMSTKIIFNCRMDRKDSKPAFVEQSGCTYIFWWDHHLGMISNKMSILVIFVYMRFKQKFFPFYIFHNLNH